MRKALSILLTLILSLSVMTVSTLADEHKPLLGDANRDGVISMRDLLHIQRYVAGLGSTSAVLSDPNEDGKVNMRDILIIQKHLAFMYTNTRCGEIMEEYIAKQELLSEDEKEEIIKAFLKYRFDNYSEEVHGKVNRFEYYGTLSDGSKLVLVRTEYMMFIPEALTTKIGKYIYSYKPVDTVSIYKNGTYTYIEDAYEAGLITDSVLDEIAITLKFVMKKWIGDISFLMWKQIIE